MSIRWLAAIAVLVTGLAFSLLSSNWLATARAMQLGAQTGAFAGQTVDGSDQPEGTRSRQSPEISFIDSPSATCYRAVPETGACFITWSYLSVDAGTTNYVITMTLTIEDELRAYHSGFFQHAMYIPGEMYGSGFEVTCGLPGEGGQPELGAAYPYAIRARDSAGLTAANYGTVYCPADTVHIHLPAIARR